VVIHYAENGDQMFVLCGHVWELVLSNESGMTWKYW
jgi:hypothetical protein